MSTFIWFLLISSAVLIISSAPSVDRVTKPSWFDIMPHLTQSQKQRTRLQQTERHRARARRRR
ncbi:hypothetical protein [Cryobacterium cryoconiti]|uniref:Uncharacterized protein n=1 Tax=Cryobacterium cryoconiti TaxID=1259239 RepID=A0A4Y8JU34_9MICO|nr:hypothetical protein [Cryobacterium cryoconiti]TFD27507.1 hypothetical protein E3T49_13275 [Cryobacterium cryoconiti]